MIFLGLAVSVNSAGSFLASPLFGWWADKRSTREVLLCTLVLMVIGNVMYSLAFNVWLLLAARFIVGIAAGKKTLDSLHLLYLLTIIDNNMYS